MQIFSKKFVWLNYFKYFCDIKSLLAIILENNETKPVNLAPAFSYACYNGISGRAHYDGGSVIGA